MKIFAYTLCALLTTSSALASDAGGSSAAKHEAMKAKLEALKNAAPPVAQEPNTPELLDIKIVEPAPKKPEPANTPKVQATLPTQRDQQVQPDPSPANPPKAVPMGEDASASEPEDAAVNPLVADTQAPPEGATVPPMSTLPPEPAPQPDDQLKQIFVEPGTKTMSEQEHLDAIKERVRRRNADQR